MTFGTENALNSYVKGIRKLITALRGPGGSLYRMFKHGSLYIGVLPGALYIGVFALFYIKGTRGSEISRAEHRASTLI